jgi:hypothetical protein
MDQGLTTGQVATILGKSRTHVYRLIERGVFRPWTDQNGRMRIGRGEVERIRLQGIGQPKRAAVVAAEDRPPWLTKVRHAPDDPEAIDTTEDAVAASREEREEQRFQREERERKRRQWADEDACKARARKEAEQRAAEETERAKAAAKRAEQARNELKEELECFPVTKLRKLYESGQLAGHEDLLAEILQPAEARFVVHGAPLHGVERRMSEIDAGLHSHCGKPTHVGGGDRRTLSRTSCDPLGRGRRDRVAGRLGSPPIVQANRPDHPKCPKSLCKIG